MSLHEKNFIELAPRLGLNETFRAGWPDFLCRRDDGRMLAVEVKGPSDFLSAHQRAMFEQLDMAGILISVWQPDLPRMLLPWRIYDQPQGGSRSRIPMKRLRFIEVPGDVGVLT